MTNTAMSAPFAEGDFRVGRVINQSVSVLSRNFPALFLISVVAYLPIQLFAQWFTGLALRSTQPTGVSPALVGIAGSLFVLTMILFSIFSQAVILHTAFQNMRQQPPNIVESLKAGLRRFLSLLLLALVIGIVLLLVMFALGLLVGGAVTLSGRGSMATVMGTIAIVVLGFVVLAMLYTMWFVAVAACVVERRGAFRSIGRSRELTKGHRWKIFGLVLLLFIVSSIVSVLVGLILRPAGSMIVTFLGNLAWSGISGAYFAISVAVTYHDLRVAKEGIDIEQIASVFD